MADENKDLIQKIDEIIFEEYGRMKSMPDIEKEKDVLFRNLAYYSAELATYVKRKIKHFSKEDLRSTKNKGIHIPVTVDAEKIDETIVKAKELVALLREANELIHSLSKDCN